MVDVVCGPEVLKFERRGGVAPTHARLCAAAIRALSQGNRREAIRAYLHVFRMDPTNAGLAVIIGDLFTEEKQIHKAAYFFRKVARHHIANRDYQKALTHLEKVSHLLPNHLKVRETMAQMHIRLRLKTREINVIENHERQAIELYQSLAEAHSEKGNDERSAQFYKRILHIDRLSVTTTHKLARALFYLNRPEEALKYLFLTINHLLEKKQLDGAEELFQEARVLNGDHPDVDAMGFRMTIARGKPAEGLNGLYNLHRTYPKNQVVILTIARTFASFGKLGDARVWFTKAFRLSRNPHPLTLVAKQYLARGHQEEALRTLLPAAQVLAADDRLREAISLLLPILHGEPHGPTLRVLYLLYRLDGNVREACKNLEDYLLLCESMDTTEGRAFLAEALIREREDSPWYRYLDDIAQRFPENPTKSLKNGDRMAPWGFVSEFFSLPKLAQV